MKNKFHEEYYAWCCDWCDSENRVPWAKIPDGANCGACHRPMNMIESTNLQHLPQSEGSISL
jgi:hypothetical protein